MGPKKKELNLIDRFFRNAGVAINERDKDGGSKGIRFPEYVGTRPFTWGKAYVYRLPVGMSYNVLMKMPLDDIFESMFNRDVDVEKGTHNHVYINVYNERLPKEVTYETKWLEDLEPYNVLIGVDGKKDKVFHDFNHIPHLIIGGMTRYGKSVLMKMIITQLALKQQGIKFHLFDLKGGLAFNRFKKLPQVSGRVARDEDESLKHLKRIRNEVKKRQLYFEAKGYEDLKEAWKAGEGFDREIIIIDEASVLAPQSKSDQVRNECRTILEFLAQVSGGLGYNLIMCSQYPTGDILPRQVKQNSDARLSFRLPTSTASGVILDETGAEELPFKQSGRAIYKTDGKKIVQVPYMDNEMIDELLAPMKAGDIIDHEQRVEVTEGRGDTKHTEEVGFVLPFATSEGTPLRQQS